MTKIALWGSGYELDWLVVLNKFLDGLSWGLGLVAAFLIFALIVRVSAKKKDGDTPTDTGDKP